MATTKTKSNLLPLNDHIIVKRLEAADKTAGGIILPEAAKEKPREGKITAVGPGRLNDNGERSPMQVKKGNRVLFTSYAGTDIRIDGEDYLILSEGDVLAIVE